MRHEFNNLYVLPTDSLGEMLPSYLDHFCVVASHNSLVMGNLTEQAPYQQNDMDFVSNVEKFLMSVAEKNPSEVIEYAQFAIEQVDVKSHYSTMLCELLLTLAERTYALQATLDDEELEDEELDNYHTQALNIIESVIDVADAMRPDNQADTLNRAIDLLIRYGEDKTDPFSAVTSLGMAIRMIGNQDRKAVVAHSLVNRCKNTVGLSPEFTVDYITDAIHALGEDHSSTPRAIAIWQECLLKMDDREQAIEYADFDEQRTSIPIFSRAIRRTLSELHKNIPPKLKLVIE